MLDSIPRAVSGICLIPSSTLSAWDTSSDPTSKTQYSTVQWIDGWWDCQSKSPGGCPRKHTCLSIRAVRVACTRSLQPNLQVSTLLLLCKTINIRKHSANESALWLAAIVGMLSLWKSPNLGTVILHQTCSCLSLERASQHLYEWSINTLLSQSWAFLFLSSQYILLDNCSFRITDPNSHLSPFLYICTLSIPQLSIHSTGAAHLRFHIE